MLRLLAHGDITLKGRMPRSSNATFLVELALDGATTLAVYKPERGERPLWDFPSGLHRREIAAYLLSEALGWGLVPPTAPRDGPL
ncbi:MAG: SCO1664 family protein, partial [Candidatus Rokuibacteriota bacterium]